MSLQDGSGGAGYRWASAIENTSRIKKVLTRASGTHLASRLKQNKFLMRVCVCVRARVCVCHSVCGGTYFDFKAYRTKETNLIRKPRSCCEDPRISNYSDLSFADRLFLLFGRNHIWVLCKADLSHTPTPSKKWRDYFKTDGGGVCKPGLLHTSQPAPHENTTPNSGYPPFP